MQSVKSRRQALSLILAAAVVVVTRIGNKLFPELLHTIDFCECRFAFMSWRKAFNDSVVRAVPLRILRRFLSRKAGYRLVLKAVFDSLSPLNKARQQPPE